MERDSLDLWELLVALVDQAHVDSPEDSVVLEPPEHRDSLELLDHLDQWDNLDKMVGSVVLTIFFFFFLSFFLLIQTFIRGMFLLLVRVLSYQCSSEFLQIHILHAGNLFFIYFSIVFQVCLEVLDLLDLRELLDSLDPWEDLDSLVDLEQLGSLEMLEDREPLDHGVKLELVVGYVIIRV